MSYLLSIRGLAISTEIGPRRCPFCCSALVHSSRRTRFSERFVLPMLLVRPFRCRQCGERHHAFAFRKFDGSEAAKAIVVDQMPQEVAFQQSRPEAVTRLFPVAAETPARRTERLPKGMAAVS